MEDYRVRRSLGEHVLRCSVLIAALFIMSLGIALSTKADLGVSPISCTPYVLSLAFPLTMGTVTILMHLSFVAVQAALLKRQFRPAHLLQIPIAFIFGFLTDFSMWIMAPLEPDGYLWSVILCLFSCVVIGFGVFLYACQSGQEDEGTGQADADERAVHPGFYGSEFPFEEFDEGQAIDREYGSGGHAIGKMLAEKLGIRFYDSELVYLTASRSGLTPDYIRKHEQQLSSRFLHELYAQNYAYTAEEMPPEDATFLAQSKVIRDITASQACVIVGRCANFILKGRPNLFSVFLHADRAMRMQRVIENYGVEPGGAARAMDIMDSRRRTHCLHYTGQELGNARLYDLCVNTSDYGLERTVELILEAINTRTEQSSAVETVPVRSASFPEPEEDSIPGEISLA